MMVQDLQRSYILCGIKVEAGARSRICCLAAQYLAIYIYPFSFCLSSPESRLRLVFSIQKMAPDTLSLQGKVAIITGSGRENGIGAGIALALARNGAKVTLNYVSDSTASRAAVVIKKIQELGGDAIAVQADITSPDAPGKLVQATLEAFKVDKIDILGMNILIGCPRNF